MRLLCSAEFVQTHINPDHQMLQQQSAQTFNMDQFTKAVLPSQMYPKRRRCSLNLRCLSIRMSQRLNSNKRYSWRLSTSSSKRSKCNQWHQHHNQSSNRVHQSALKPHARPSKKNPIIIIINTSNTRYSHPRQRPN